LYRHRFDVRVFRRVDQMLGEIRPDVVFTDFSRMNLLFGGWPAALRFIGRIVVAFHSTHTYGRRLVRWIDRLFLPRVSDFIAVGEAQGRYLVREEGIAPDRLHVIHNGVDIQRFRPDVPMAEELRVRKDRGVPLIGIVAALRREKAHDVFLRAASRVLQEIPHAEFFIIGDGPQREYLLKQIAAYNLAGSVHWLGMRKDTEAIYPALDVKVLCSSPIHETFSISILEAMASGRPVVTTDVGSLRELVVDGETGYFVPHSNPEALAEKIVNLLHDSSLRTAMGIAARRRVEQLFSLDTMVRAYEEVFDPKPAPIPATLPRKPLLTPIRTVEEVASLRRMTSRPSSPRLVSLMRENAVPSAQCPVPSAQCPVPNEGAVASAQCPVPGA
jgi:glycosyltransferase involved in cell wall biosynthesis